MTSPSGVLAGDERMLIDGELQDTRSGAKFDVVHPGTGEVAGQATDGTVEDMGRAVGAARRAFDTTSWSRDPEFRYHCLTQLHAALTRDRERLRRIIVTEVGCPVGVTGSQIDGPIEEVSHWAGLGRSFGYLRDTGLHQANGRQSRRLIQFDPVGVVGAITPWNAPFMTDIWKIQHALASGNTVVLKTAPDTPLTGAFIAKVAHEQTDLPPGVLNVISSLDKAAAGEALTGDPRVDMYHFTGSPAVGQRIYERAAVGIRKVCLELGGKSANIILDDADLALALPMTVGMCMANSGQGCALATRLVVHASRYDEVLDALTAAVGALPWGDPTDPVNIVGPIINAAQLWRMEGLVDRARDAGGLVLVGGRRGDSPTGGRGFWS
jgi:aldehyde dehydrogenase (NAD+)